MIFCPNFAHITKKCDRIPQFYDRKLKDYKLVASFVKFSLPYLFLGFILNLSKIKTMKAFVQTSLEIKNTLLLGRPIFVLYYTCGNTLLRIKLRMEMGNVPKRQQPDHRKKQQQKVTNRSSM